MGCSVRQQNGPRLRRSSAIEHILILSIQLYLTDLADLVLPNPVLLDHVVEVIVYFVVVIHQLVPPAPQVLYDLALLDQTLGYFLLVSPLLLDELLVLEGNTLDLGLELHFLS